METLSTLTHLRTHTKSNTESSLLSVCPELTGTDAALTPLSTVQCRNILGSYYKEHTTTQPDNAKRSIREDCKTMAFSAKVWIASR